MANAGCINAYDCNGDLIQTLQNLDSACIGVGVQFCAPDPLDDKRLDYIKYTDRCGCVQCLTDENEILIYATNGVVKNFTLTNNEDNEAVVVTRDDIFGSNWSKSVVRYSDTAYPTSVSDGTLAVEETIMNTYSTTGYSVNGLEDGTTYYFTIFALDDALNVISTQQATITPEFDRHPTANTIAYYPLTQESALLDKSGNGHNLTLPNGAVTYDTSEFSRGIYNGGHPMRFGNLGTFDGSSGVFTVSFMFKSTADSGLFRFTNRNNGDRNNFDASTTSGQVTAGVFTGSGANWTARGSGLADGNRHHIVITKNGSTYTGFQDGEQKSTWTNSSTIVCYNFSQIGCHPNSSSVATTQRMSEFIVESIAWSLTNAQDYFKKIKRHFNLS